MYFIPSLSKDGGVKEINLKDLMRLKIGNKRIVTICYNSCNRKKAETMEIESAFLFLREYSLKRI